MGNEAEEVEELNIPLVWVGLDEAPIVLANQYLCQIVGPNQFVVTIGQGVAPPLLGTKDEIWEQLQRISHVPVKPLARLSFTEETLQQLLLILQDGLKNYQQMTEEAGTQ